MDDLDLAGRCEGNLGIAYKNLACVSTPPKRNLLLRARRHQEQALKISLGLGDKRSEGRCLGNLGIVYSNLGDAEKAVAHYSRAKQVAADLGDRRHFGIWCFNTAEDLLKIDSARALEEVQEARSIFSKLGLFGYVAMCEDHLETLHGCSRERSGSETAGAEPDSSSAPQSGR